MHNADGKKYKKKEGAYFINPYNYVSGVKNTKNIFKEEREEKRYTGVLDCGIKVFTPVTIMDFDEKLNPMIPGSSLRGPIRSVYETLTDSCFSTTKKDEALTARVKPGGFKPGVLVEQNKEKDEWKLYSAKRYIIPVKNYTGYKGYKPIAEVKRNKEEESLVMISDGGGEKEHYFFGDIVEATYSENPYKKNNDIVWSGMVETIQKPSNPENGEECCVIHIGEPFSKKHGESLFVYKSNSKPSFTIDHYKIQGLKKTYSDYRNDGINKKYGKEHFGYSGFIKAYENGIVPVWYYEKEGVLQALSLAAVGRKAFTYRISSTVGERCNSRKELCPACALFGFVSDQKDGSKGSRIRISDAIYSGKEAPVLERHILKELGQPRVSYMMFHSKKGKDYDDGGEIRGRKYYWHNLRVKEDKSLYCHRLDDTDRNEWSQDDNKEFGRSSEKQMIMPPKSKDISFSFKVYFDEITSDELKNLMWSLTFGNNKDKGYKIGSGKPLGLGSIRFTIKQVLIRNNDKYSITDLLSDDPSGIITGWEDKFCDGKDTVKELLCLSDINGPQGENDKGIKIQYPFVEESESLKKRREEYHYSLGKNDLANHRWFANNEKQLPPPLKEQRLPVYEQLRVFDFIVGKVYQGSIKEEKGNKYFDISFPIKARSKYSGNYECGGEIQLRYNNRGQWIPCDNNDETAYREERPRNNIPVNRVCNKEMGVNYSVVTTGRIIKEVFVEVEFEKDHTKESVYYRCLDRKANTPQSIEKGSRFTIKYNEIKGNGYPNWEIVKDLR